MTPDQRDREVVYLACRMMGLADHFAAAPGYATAEVRAEAWDRYVGLLRAALADQPLGCGQ